MSDAVLIVVVVGFFGVLTTAVTASVPWFLARQTNERADILAARVLAAADSVATKLAESNAQIAARLNEATKITNGKLDEIYGAVTKERTT